MMSWDTNKADDNSQWMQAKLYNEQLTNEFGFMTNYYGTNQNDYEAPGYFHTQPPKLANYYAPSPKIQSLISLPTTSNDKEFDVSILKGDDLSELEIFNKPTIEKDTVSRSSYNSTCKSTSHSHQENIPNPLAVASEEIKFEGRQSPAPKTSESAMKLSCLVKRVQKQKNLGLESKYREPLTVRKIDKNQADM